MSDYTLADFLDCLFEPTDLVELRAFPHPRGKATYQGWKRPAEIVAMNGELARINERDSVYFSANPRPKIGDSTNADIKLCRCVFADFDGGMTWDIARERIEDAGLPYPSAVVASGGGVHVWWRLDMPIDPEAFRLTNAALAKLLDADDIKDPARVMRLPGTVNRKPERNGSRCRVLEVTDERPDHEDIVRCLPAPTDGPPPPSEPLDPDERRQIPAWVLQLQNGVRQPAKGDKRDGRNQTAYKIGAAYKGNGWPIEHARQVIRLFADACTPPLDHAEADAALASAYAGDRKPTTHNDTPPVEGVGVIANLETSPIGDKLPATESKPRTTLPPEVTKTLVKLDASDPYTTGQQYIAQRYGGTVNRLHHHRGEWWRYDGRAYITATDDQIKAELYRFVDYKPTRANVAGVMDATKATAWLYEALEPPTWLGDASGRPDPADVLPMANGLLNLRTRELHPHDAALFAVNALAFDFDPAATCPEWLAFLESIWGEDSGQINTLAEWFGYLISGRTDQQKIGLIVGPKRSGKGTINRMKTELLGRANCCSPTLNSLSQNFGMQSLLNKMDATISDARLSSRADQQTIAERLLSVSGEDPIGIDRKFKNPWTGKLGARFTIMTNELPRLADSSGALAGRFVVLVMQRSFFGREDVGLTNRLLGELPGVFNWALAGLDRLNARGHFIQPASSADAIAELEALGSPVQSFVDECCTVGPGCNAEVDRLFARWKSWCDEQGRDHPGTKQSFGRDLRAAVAGVRLVKGRVGDVRTRRYEGVGMI